MAPKKGRRAKRGEDDSDEDLKTQTSNSTEATESGNPQAPQKRTSKKKQAKKKGKVGDWSDDEAAPAATGAEESTEAGENGTLALQEEHSNPPALRQPKHGRKKAAASGFAALELDEDDPEAEAEEEYQAAMPEIKHKKGKKKATTSFAALEAGEDGIGDVEAQTADKDMVEAVTAIAGFAALDLEENGEHAEEDSREAARSPQHSSDQSRKQGQSKNKGSREHNSSIPALSLQVARIVAVGTHPNADKLKVCTVETGSGTFKVVTNAAAAREGLKVVFAGVGCTTPGSGIRIEWTSLRGVESSGMLCSAFDIGWMDEPDGVLVELPETAQEGEEVTSTPIEGAIYGPSAAKESQGKKEKKKKSKKDIGFADLGEDGVEQAKEEPVVADKKGKREAKAGAEAAASAFAALDIEDPATEEPKEEAMANGRSAEAEVGTSHAADYANFEAAELLLGGKKKKSKVKAFDPDAIFAAATNSEPSAASAVAVEAKTNEEGPPPEKKKKEKKKADIDLDAMLAEATGEAPKPVVVEEPLPAATTSSAPEEVAQEDQGSKKSKQKKGKEDAEEEDLDALLAQFGVNTEAAAEGKKSKKKKKGKAPAGEEALASSVGLAATEEAAAAQSTSAVEAPASSAATVEEIAPEAQNNAATTAENHEAEAEAEGDVEATDADGKELSAAQKKKLKKKAKEKAKKVGPGEEEDVVAPPKKGGKKESAAVRKLREEMERQRAAQEAAVKAEEERIRREEEEARRAEEEAKQKEEDKQRRKEEKARQRAELKRQGLLKTGKEKQEAERLAAMREQFLKNNPGVELPSAGGEQAQKKKVVYGRKKAAPKKLEGETSIELNHQDEAEAAAKLQAEEIQRKEEEERRKAEEAAKAKAEAEAAAAAAAAAGEAEDSDSIGWEDIDEDHIKLPGQDLSSPLQDEEEEEEEEEQEEEQEMPQAKVVPNGKAKGAALQAREAKKPKLEATKQTPPAARHAPAEAGAEEPESSEEEEEEEEEESSSEEQSSSDEEESSTEYSDSEDESVDSEEAREERLRQARAARAEKMAAARQAGSAEDLRSPICCILGHVDTGKTKLLDNIRRTSVQEGEAGGITQQIGATYVPGDAIRTRTEPVRKGREFELKLPGLLIIDTPGHESFTNLRSRGSSLCDIAILVVDIMHGLEPQTIESINLLKQKKTPFIVALNKVDRLFEWDASANAGIQDSLGDQKPHVQAEFEKKLQQATLNLNEQGLNVALYWKNPDPRKYVNIVPTSAITGEGIPDMLQLLVQLTQKMMAERLMFISELQCTVLEVKVIEGLGTTIDVVLVNGVLHEGDQIVLCGLQGPIVTSIRSLLTPHPLKELRVRGSYLHHKEIRAAQGIKIAAQNLENAVAGTQMLVVQKGDSIEDLKEEVMGDMTDIFKSVDKSGEGVCVQASTLGSLEALLEFLRSDAVRIPVSGINIGPVHKRDVMRASTMLEKGRKKFAVILAFDVPVTREAQEQATGTGVRIFTADIIYHLFDQFSAYLKHTKEEEQQAAAAEAVFPVILEILPNCIFNTKDPIVLGCQIKDGIAKVGTALCVPSRGGFTLGKISSMELNHKPVDVARRGDSIALKIEATNADESAKLYGRHFDFKDELISKISRRSIDLLKLHFKDDLERDDWRLVVKLKKVFGID